MIEIRHLSLSRGKFCLRDIDLRVGPGECLVLIGPSGAGKTLLLETLLGIHEPEAGEIVVGCEDLTRRPPERRGFAYVPQDLALFPHLSVYENVAFSRRGRGAREEAERAVRQAAGWLGIGHLLERRGIMSLSGGEKQRVALARALVAEPRVLFLDEPFNSLDAALRRELVRELAELRRRIGLTMVLVTHDFDEMFALGDRVALLMEGRIHQVGTPEEVWRRPATVAAARLLLVENLFPVDGVTPGESVERCRFRLGQLSVEGPVPDETIRSERMWLGIRAQHVRVGEVNGAAIPVRVRRVERRAGRWMLSVSFEACPERTVEVVLAESAEESHYGEGTPLVVGFPPEHLMLIPESLGTKMPREGAK